MSSIPFCKFHGFGNDYIVIERDAIGGSMTVEKLAADICHRYTGAGADGIAVIEKLDGVFADFSCEIVNPDGSVAGFSGNGTRCAVAYLYHKGQWTGPDLRLQMKSGVKNYHLVSKEGGGFWFKAEIGKPRFASEEIPVLTETRRDHVVNEPIVIAGSHYNFSAINVGNPVACIFVENFDLDWRAIGREMETHDKFPDRANIVFVNPVDRGNIEIRIWERGAGETSASGTCSSAAAVLSAFMLRSARKVSVHSLGGVTEVDWRDDDEIVLTGRADLAYQGEWPI